MLIGMLSSVPGYNRKINFGVTIGTAVYFGNVRSAVLKFMTRRKSLVEVSLQPSIFSHIIICIEVKLGTPSRVFLGSTSVEKCHLRP